MDDDPDRDVATPPQSPTQRKGIQIQSKRQLPPKHVVSTNNDIRAQIYLIFEVPEAGRFSRILQVMILGCIAASVTMFVWESFPAAKSFETEFGILEWVFTAIFTLEFALRFWVCNVFGTQTRKEFLQDTLNILDLCAILPAYLEAAFASLIDVSVLRVFRVVRLVRLFRLLRLGSFRVGVALIHLTISRAVITLLVLFFILGIVVVFFGSLIYYAERYYCPQDLLTNPADYTAYTTECKTKIQGYTSRGSLEHADKLCCEVFNAHASDVDERAYAAKGFESIIHSLWWSLVTVSTVGYGDFFPQTELGKYIGMAVTICGILILSLPVGIVGSEFHEAYNELDRDPPNLKYWEKTFQWLRNRKDNRESIKKAQAARDGIINKEATANVSAFGGYPSERNTRDDLASLPYYDDQHPERAKCADRVMKKLKLLVFKMLEDEAQDDIIDDSIRKGRYQLPGQDQRVKRTMYQHRQEAEEDAKELQKRLDDDEEKMYSDLVNGIIPKELLFPKVGSASSGDRQKMKEDVLSNLMQKAGMGKNATTMAVKGMNARVVANEAKEYPLRDFEVIVTNICSCLRYQSFLDQRFDEMTRDHKQLDRQLITLFGEMLGEQW
ncbi:unnamed protein product [Amoebophrya sp. A25]|nr:unnamed protein product [Amoebophrya sp. A25]|eukprot:GSA25T00018544001.1